MRNQRLFSLFSLSALAIVVLFPAHLRASDAVAQPASSTSPSDAEQLIQVFETVLRHHVSPPTLQQMVHESIEEIYRKRKVKMPARIAGELSEATSRDEVLSLLERELEPLGALGSDGMISRLPHRLGVHGVIVTPNKAHSVNQQLAANRYVGIGIAISGGGEKTPQIAQIVEGGAADLSARNKGDEIFEVDGKQTAGHRLETVIDWIRGPAGTNVDLVLRRRGANERVTMKRDIVPIKTVQKPIASKSGRTVGIKLDRVSASNVHELRKIEAALDPETETVILDFRTAVGAENLHYGELLADALIDDAVVGIVEDREGAVTQIRAGPGALFGSTRFYIVIDGQTGPVLKWIAAALKDSGQATIAGAPATRNAIVRDSHSIPAETVTVSVPARKLGRANGDSLIPVKGNGALFQHNLSAAEPILMQRLNTAAAMPGYRTKMALGIVYPDPMIRSSSAQTNVARRTRATATSVPPLSQLLEKIDDLNKGDEPAPSATEDVK